MGVIAPLVGVLISAIVAAWIGRLQAERSFASSQLEAASQYRDRIQAKRIEVYPAAYEILSDLGRHVVEGTASREEMRILWRQLQAWDRSHALLLGPLLTRRMIELREVLIPLGADDASERPSRNALQKHLRPAIIEVQRCMKAEIGVLGQGDFHAPSQPGTMHDYVSS